MQATFDVYRYAPEHDEEPHFSRYRLEIEKGTTVLAALLRIQDEIDGTLAFRYSCRGAVCGSCAMVVDGRATLACRTQVASCDLSKPVVVEPLPNLEVVRDLVVDMKPFWDAYRKVEPWLQPDDAQPERERLQSQSERERLEPFANCVLCACCYGVCPVLARSGRYLGPAALAALWRFVADSRDARKPGEVTSAKSLDGVWGCHSVLRCVKECPKNIRPAEGIVRLRKSVFRSAFKRGGKKQ